MINQNLLLTGDDGYNLTNSLRFRASATANLQRTPATTTSQTTWTWSGWVKRGQLSTSNAQYLFGTYPASGQTDSNWIEFGFYTDNTLAVGGWTVRYLGTTQVFRDPSAWYHIVLAIDSTQATGSNRVKLYVNGVQITAFATNNSPSLNQTMGGVNSTVVHCIGNSYPSAGSKPFDGYIAENHFIDGQQLTPSSFGSTNASTGVWQPAKYTGTYGTNGFYLPFTDNSALTSGSNAGLGKDFSGNGNYWNTNNISITSGSTYDSMTDVPTLTSATQANYAVMNPLWKLGGSGYITPTNGNLTVTSPGNNIIASTIPVPSTGKYYMEFVLTTAVYPEFGLCNNSANGGGGANNIFGMYMSLWFANGVYGSHDGNVPDTSGDIGLIAVDADNNKLWIGRNRSGTVVWMGGGNPSSATNPSFSASGGGGVYATTFNAQTFNNPFVASGGGSDVWDANFGQRGFTGTPPTGFVALNTYNLPTPIIGATASTLANKNFDVTTYSGQNTSLTVTNSGSMQPDFVWIKTRNLTDGHDLIDSVRGASQNLYSNTTAAEDTVARLTSFNSNGVTLAGGYGYTNASGQTYVAWQWKASNATAVSNTAGSITSTVSANPTAGFSVVTYSANGSTGTIGHGLGVAPSMIIVKKRNAAERWCVYHVSTSNAYLYLNETFAAETGNANIRFGDNSVVVQPTSSVFTIGSSNDVNGTSGTYVAYCFAEVAGYSKFGSYTGNGSTDGTFVHLGFRPKFVMFKRTNTTGDWTIIDTARDTYNFGDKELFPNLSDAETVIGGGLSRLDILSNGFKVRGADSYQNANGSTYIYMAFAENPAKYALAR